MGSHSVHQTGWALMIQSGLVLSLQKFFCLNLPNARIAGVIMPSQVLISIYALKKKAQKGVNGKVNVPMSS